MNSDPADRAAFHSRRMNQEPDLTKRLRWACDWLTAEAHRQPDHVIKNLIAWVAEMAISITEPGGDDSDQLRLRACGTSEPEGIGGHRDALWRRAHTRDTTG